MSDNLCNVYYFAGAHGTFITYFLDKFSKHTPDITKKPFHHTGTSHALDIDFSRKFEKILIEDKNGNPHNNYEVNNHDESNIVVLIDNESLCYFLRMNFYRPSDHEWTGNTIYEMRDYVSLSDYFVRNYKQRFMELYDLDISNKKSPKAIMRDFFKITFLEGEKNRILTKSRETLKNKSENTIFITLSEILQTESFISKMREASDRLNLQLEIQNDAIKLHQEFLAKNFHADSLDRTQQVIESLQNNVNYQLTDLDLVEQGYISAWIEKNYKFTTVPFMRNYFRDTAEILEFVDTFPNHYKAMNGNMPKWQGGDNPFYLWKHKK